MHAFQSTVLQKSPEQAENIVKPDTTHHSPPLLVFRVSDIFKDTSLFVGSVCVRVIVRGRSRPTKVQQCLLKAELLLIRLRSSYLTSS